MAVATLHAMSSVWLWVLRAAALLVALAAVQSNTRWLELSGAVALVALFGWILVGFFKSRTRPVR